MKILGLDKLDAFTRKHADTRSWIETWISVVEGAKWGSPQELKKRYSKASVLSDNEVFFDVKGDHYRLKVKIAYNTSTVLIQWVGTHAEYTRRFKGGK